MAQKPETLFYVNKVKPDLEKLPNTWFVKVQMVALRGIPDVLLCVCGFFIAMELKKDEKQGPSPLQEWNLQGIGRAGGMAFVVHPGNWKETYELLKEIALTGEVHT